MSLSKELFFFYKFILISIIDLIVDWEDQTAWMK